MVIWLERFAPALLKARFKIERVCDLILYVPPILELIGAYFLEFYVIFQSVLDFTGERGEIRSPRPPNRAAWHCARIRWIAPHNAGEGASQSPETPSSRPVAIILTMSRRSSVIRSRSSRIALFSARTSSARFSISSALATSGVRSKPKALLDLAPLPSSGKAFAVGGIAANDQPGIDEASEMAAQRRRRHAMGADRQFLIRGEHDDAGAPLPGFVVGAPIGAGSVKAVSW